MNIKNYFFATGIGSLSFLDKEKAVGFILENFNNHIPFWPQLPKVSFLESMHIQFSEGLPGRIVDLDKRNISIDTQRPSFVEQFEKCYNSIHSNQLDYFSMGKDYAAGFYEFIKQIRNKDFKFIKGQIIGPITFGMTLLDEKKRPLLFNAELNEIIPLFLNLKARWQINRLKQVTKNNIIIFIDEPYLVAVGTSQFASLDKSRIIAKIDSLVEAIHSEGAFAGIHCCGNTDWSICFETQIDILSFDAFEFLDSLFIYRDSLNKFVAKGGILACGIVPNRQDYNLDGYIEKAIEALKKHKILLENGALITCSCGCGTVSQDFAKRAHLLTIKIAEACSSLQK